MTFDWLSRTSSKASGRGGETRVMANGKRERAKGGMGARGRREEGGKVKEGGKVGGGAFARVLSMGDYNYPLRGMNHYLTWI